MAKRNGRKVSDLNMPKGSKIKYYVLNDKERGYPRATVAIGNIDGIFCRGVALCSPTEIKAPRIVSSHTSDMEGEVGYGFDEGYGRDKARHRMLRAFNRKENGLPVCSNNGVRVVHSIYGRKYVPPFLGFKSGFDVTPTQKENLLFRH